MQTLRLRNGMLWALALLMLIQALPWSVFAEIPEPPRPEGTSENATWDSRYGLWIDDDIQGCIDYFDDLGLKQEGYEYILRGRYDDWMRVAYMKKGFTWDDRFATATSPSGEVFEPPEVNYDVAVVFPHGIKMKAMENNELYTAIEPDSEDVVLLLSHKYSLEAITNGILS